MLRSMRKGDKIFMVLFLGICVILWAFPLTLCFVESFKIGGIKNYINVIQNQKVSYFRVVFNSFVITFFTTIIVVTITVLAGYAFSKMKFRLKEPLYFSMLACLTIPAVAVISPVFFTVKSIGLVGTSWAVILPLVAFLSPYILMLTKVYLDTIPYSLMEAAFIDGCGSLRTLLFIIVPVGRPAIINAIVLTFINSWNEFLLPLVFMQRTEDYTVPLTAQFYVSAQHQTPDMVAQLYAALIMMALPNIIIYLLAQNHLKFGITAGAVKE